MFPLHTSVLESARSSVALRFRVRRLSGIPVSVTKYRLVI